MPVSIKGSGGGGVTLDAGAAASNTTLTLPNVSGTVLQSGTAVTAAQGGTGLTSPGSSGNVLTSDGTGWTSAAAKVINVQSFDSSGVWTKPSGYSANSRVFIQAWAGGGSGARHTTAASASGGGGGGYSERWVNLSQLGATETVTIGAGGVSRTGSNQSGDQGGNTSVTITTGGTFTVYGGAGGIQAGNGGGGGGQLSAASGFTPGLPFFVTDSGGAKQGIGDATIQSDGAAMFHGGGGGYTTSAPGKNSVWGGGGGGGAGASGATVAGTSINGGSGGTGGATGTAGTQPAGGGGGGTTTSGAGGAGRVIITVFPA